MKSVDDASGEAGSPDRERVELAPKLQYLEEARALNERLHEGSAELDWSRVIEMSAAYVSELVAGIKPHVLAESLGSDTVRDRSVEQQLRTILAEARQRPRPPRTAEAVLDHPLNPKRPQSSRPPTKASAKLSSASERDADVRAQLVSALEADLVGPFSGDETQQEILPLAPSRWYLTGFLAPQGRRDTEDPTSEEDSGSGSDKDEEDSTGSEPEAKQRRCYPASLGLSVLLPPAGSEPDSVQVSVTFADYVPELAESHGSKSGKTFWRRQPARSQHVVLELTEEAIRHGKELPNAPGVWVQGKLERSEAPGLPSGARGLAIFLVNRREAPLVHARMDEACLFQAGLTLRYERGLLPRPNRRGEGIQDWDEQVLDLQFRERFEYAVGHGVSAHIPNPTAPVTTVETTWLPRHEVRRVVTHEEPSVTTEMEALAQLDSADAVVKSLGSLPELYGEWLKKQAKAEVGIDSETRRGTRDQLVRQADRARGRIAAGIECLRTDTTLLEAFRLTNEAMALAAQRRNPKQGKRDAPKWRLFQLAFLLLNIPALANDEHEDRTNVELIFFPTGGGKTEAYLGVIAFTLLLRRMRGQRRTDRGLGVAVLLRYTLRLLTLDQLSRAATLICALETLRQRAPEKLGDIRFAVGLWVGRSATANTMEQVKTEVIDYKNNAYKESPCPLTNCPWCGSPLGPDSLTLKPSPTKPEAIVVACTSFRCEFSARQNPSGIPVVFVDEQVYRELPAFIVATVDKFAMLPWRGETGMLFGRVTARQDSAFFGPLDTQAKGAIALPDGLRPPELIVQDELHLISGPLGTMVGLYETAIESLCSRQRADGSRIVPKVIASTATVRRAQDQIRALFGRSEMALFPPPGIDDSETWFATIDRAKPGRLYVGVAAQGRSLKRILLQSYATLLGSAQREFTALGGDAAQGNLADPYMTLAGYFNSLRELGGMRRLVEDDVRTRCAQAHENKPINYRGSHPFLSQRRLAMEPVELTSRETTAKIKKAKDRLTQAFVADADPKPVDVLLASNMISVGVDIDRLGLMVVAGQPKTTSEYIQATSRVGREYPGLVVTCFNVARPRDRSHYERFVAYHESFYRFVEATSITPFSGPALERGLAGTLVAMTRLGEPVMTPPEAAMRIRENRTLGEQAVQCLAERGGAHHGSNNADSTRLTSELGQRGHDLLDAWETIIKRSEEEAAARRSYSKFDREKSAGKPILHTAMSDETPEEGSLEAKFILPTSMRDVEESVHLWIERGAVLGARSSQGNGQGGER